VKFKRGQKGCENKSNTGTWRGNRRRKKGDRILEGTNMIKYIICMYGHTMKPSTLYN
jgi:hypothetical protein